MKIWIDFDGLQTADQGDTTYYGGVVRVCSRLRVIEVQATGSDREFNLQLDCEGY